MADPTFACWINDIEDLPRSIESRPDTLSYGCRQRLLNP